MAPMIDKVFLLLAFFMTVSTLADSERAAPVELPEATQGVLPRDAEGRGVVSVDAEGVAYLGEAKVTNEVLTARLKEELALEPELKLVLRVDRSCTFGKLKPLLTLCTNAGVQAVLFAAHELRAE